MKRSQLLLTLILVLGVGLQSFAQTESDSLNLEKIRSQSGVDQSAH